eukprot:786249-Pelagomonas_calceolata.AAC.1
MPEPSMPEPNAMSRSVLIFPELDNSPQNTGVFEMPITHGAPNLEHLSEGVTGTRALLSELGGTLPNQLRREPYFLTTIVTPMDVSDEYEGHKH